MLKQCSREVSSYKAFVLVNINSTFLFFYQFVVRRLIQSAQWLKTANCTYSLASCLTRHRGTYRRQGSHNRSVTLNQIVPHLHNFCHFIDRIRIWRGTQQTSQRTSMLLTTSPTTLCSAIALPTFLASLIPQLTSPFPRFFSSFYFRPFLIVINC